LTDIRTEPIADASAWRGSEVEADRSWEFTCTDAHIDELEQALDQIGDTSLIDLDLSAFRRPALSSLMDGIRREVQHGRGFALLHGFPVQGYSDYDLERLYWGLMSHVGIGMTQNCDAGLIHYVTDGKRRPQMGSRGVGRPGPVGLHIDLTDCVSLLCMQQAPDDPPSRLASALHVYNEILRHHPEALPRLYEGFEWDRQNEHGETETPTTGYRVPVFSQRDGVVSCRYNRGWIGPACERLGQPLTDAEKNIFDFMGSVSSEACFEFPFHTGDIQFANNFTVLHGRAGHTEVAEEEHKRVLLRLWLDFVDEPRPVAHEGLIRYGLVRHGALGWTAADLANGRHRVPHRRDAAGLPIV
jgi:hypothetical protein